MTKRSVQGKKPVNNKSGTIHKSWKSILLWYILPSCILGGVITLFLMFFLGIYVIQTYARMEDLLQGTPWNLPTRIYGRSYELFVGSEIKRSNIIDRLVQLGYYPVSSVQSSGEYSWDEKGLDLHLHDIPTMDGNRQGFPVRLEVSNNVIIGIWNSDTGKHLSSVMLDPELLGSIYDPSTEDRRPMLLEAVPQQYIDCLLLSEDNDFFKHHGVDPLGIARAFWINLKEQRYAQGGSTITQQLVRSLFLTRKRTIRRKAEEALMAVLLEITRSKDQILELYINECYYGQAGAINIAGLRQASRYYFGTEPRDLTLPQCAMLIAMLRGPNYYNPFKYPERVKKRRDYILARMCQQGKISAEERDQAMETPLPEAPHSLSGSAPYVVDAVRRSLSDLFDVKELQTKGYSIFTTIDPHLQSTAQQALREGLSSLEENYPGLKQSSQTLQAALIAIDPYSGAVRAMVGGRNFGESQYNRVLLAERPVGSVIKPFLALCALEGTYRGDYEWTPNSLLNDLPITIQTPSGPWTPQNYSRENRGLVTLRRTIEHSINVPTVRLSQRIGIDVFADFLKKLGVQSPPRVPTLVLGTLELTPYKVAGMYTPFPNRGEKASPFFIQSIITTDDEKIRLSPPSLKTVASPEASYQVLSMLEGVFKRGTASISRQLGWKGIAAGKTGTTDDRRDAWFVGMTPDLITVVWAGHDEPESTGLTGSMGALPIWIKFMNQIYPEGNQEPFPVPGNLVRHRIYYSTGELAYEDGPNVINEYFLKNTIEEEEPSIKKPAPVRKEEVNEKEFFTRPLPNVDIPESRISNETTPEAEEADPFLSGNQ